MEPIKIEITHLKQLQDGEIKTEELRFMVERKDKSNEYFYLSIEEAEVLVERLQEKLKSLK